jgi:NitT/TauT family transport system ATP-binding protein
MTEPLIRLRNMRKTYRGRGGDVLAVSDVTLDITEGELLSLVGPSGCGKTTLLKILADLTKPDAGGVEIGNDRSRFLPGRDVGMVFQQALLLKWRTILDNVTLPAEILRLPRGPTRALARELLALVGLAGFEDKYPYERHAAARRDRSRAGT